MHLHMCVDCLDIFFVASMENFPIEVYEIKKLCNELLIFELR